MADVMMRYLDRQGVLDAGGGDWPRAVADVRVVLELMSRGEAAMEPECVLPLGADPREKAYGLPARVGGAYDAAGLKWTVHRAKPAGDLPSAMSLTLINRLADGRPVGLVESALLTRMRTAAVSALTIECLCPRPSRVGLIGAGAQAESHLDMLAALFPDVQLIRVWNRSPEARDRMLAISRDPRLRPADRLDDLLTDCDVILACTSARAPLLSRTAVRTGRLIMQVGFHEVDFDAIEATDYVIVDQWGEFWRTSAKSLFQMTRSGRFSPERVSADLVDLCVRGWRAPTGASLYFSSFGLNVFDIALAARVLAAAADMRLGTLLPTFGAMGK
jgi:ornithine cyclodeaminase